MNDGVYVRMPDGSLRPALPLPYYLAFGWVKCECGRRFPSERRYHAHWRTTHERAS